MGLSLSVMIWEMCYFFKRGTWISRTQGYMCLKIVEYCINIVCIFANLSIYTIYSYHLKHTSNINWSFPATFCQSLLTEFLPYCCCCGHFYPQQTGSSPTAPSWQRVVHVPTFRSQSDHPTTRQICTKVKAQVRWNGWRFRWLREGV